VKPVIQKCANLFNVHNQVKFDSNVKCDTTNIPTLNETEYTLLEGPITDIEIYNTVKKMKKDKSPVPDGFTIF